MINSPVKSLSNGPFEERKGLKVLDENLATLVENQLSAIAGAIAEPARARILCSLMNGQAWTATELGSVSGVSPSTTSSHLDKLLTSGLINCLQQGRHRYYSITRHEVAELLEKMMAFSVTTIPVLETKTPSHLRYARTCYDHLAGEVAVKMYAYMLKDKWLSEDQLALSDYGFNQFEKLGIYINRQSRRKQSCPCLDWSERHFHLGGEAGASFLRYGLEHNLFNNVIGYREISITRIGMSFFNKWFDI